MYCPHCGSNDLAWHGEIPEGEFRFNYCNNCDKLVPEGKFKETKCPKCDPEFCVGCTDEEMKLRKEEREKAMLDNLCCPICGSQLSLYSEEGNIFGSQTLYQFLYYCGKCDNIKNGRIIKTLQEANTKGMCCSVCESDQIKLYSKDTRKHGSLEREYFLYSCRECGSLLSDQQIKKKENKMTIGELMEILEEFSNSPEMEVFLGSNTMDEHDDVAHTYTDKLSKHEVCLMVDGRVPKKLTQEEIRTAKEVLVLKG